LCPVLVRTGRVVCGGGYGYLFELCSPVPHGRTDTYPPLRWGNIHIYAAWLQVPTVYRGEGTPLPVTVFAGSPVGSSVRYCVTRVRPSYSQFCSRVYLGGIAPIEATTLSAFLNKRWLQLCCDLRQKKKRRGCRSREYIHDYASGWKDTTQERNGSQGGPETSYGTQARTRETARAC
jgi:hypothetical protein